MKVLGYYALREVVISETPKKTDHSRNKYHM